MTGVKLPLTGGCLCGACRYELRAAPFMVYACHCTDCQTQSGSAFNMSMPSPRADFQVTRGEPAIFRREMPGGRVSEVAFCGTCGSRLFALSNETTAVIRPGTLDDASWVKPGAQNWTRSAHPWALIEGVAAFETQPEDFRELLRAWRAIAPTFTS